MKISSNVLRVIIAVIILIAVILIGIIWQRVSYSGSLTRAKKQAENYDHYQVEQEKIDRVKRGEGDYLYYYAADNKRYVFPTIDVYRSWYGNYSIDNLVFEDTQTMYKTALGGNVTFRPGTLLKSPTLFQTFIVVKNGTIRPFASEELLTAIFGSDWQKQVYELPDYYFSQYQIGDPIKFFEEFPDISVNITIDLDKGLK